MLQAIAAKGLKSAKAISAPSSARSCSRKVVNNKSSPSSRLVAARVTPLRIDSKLYSTTAPRAGGDNENVWEDLNGINDFYDPRWDTDVPEEEGTSIIDSS